MGIWHTPRSEKLIHQTRWENMQDFKMFGNFISILRLKKFVDFYRPKCVDRRYLFYRCSEFFLQCMVISGYKLYVTFLFIFLALYSSSKRNIISHIGGKLFGLHDAERGKQEMGYLYPNDKLLLHRGTRPRCCKNGYCLANTKKGRKAG